MSVAAQWLLVFSQKPLDIQDAMEDRPQLSPQDLLARNSKIRGSLKPLPYLTEGLTYKPGTIVVTCADPRCVPETFFDVESAYAIPAVRNAGGKADPAIRDIVILDGLIGLKDIMLIHHSDCGVTHYTNEQISGFVQKYNPDSETAKAGYDWGAVPTVEQAVKTEFAKLKSNKMLRQELRDNTKGYIFDLKTREVKLVVE